MAKVIKFFLESPSFFAGIDGTMSSYHYQAGMGFWKNLFSGSVRGESSEEMSSSVNYGASGEEYPLGAGEVSSQTLRDSGSQTLSRGAAPNVRIFFSTDRDLDLYELEELCDAVGWSRRPLRKVKKAIQHSFLVVSMWEVRGAKRRLIGFCRATSDHAFNATLWDVVVHPDYQGKGLGKALMKFLIKKLRSEDISNITLFADPHVVDFYRTLGFMPDPEGIKGMFWYPD